MTKEELLKLLGIESGEEITYFEDFAGIIEEPDMDPDALTQVLSEADMTTFSELTESYFYDVMENLPDDVDIYNFFEAEKRNLLALARSGEHGDGNAIRKLADELSAFANHYSGALTCRVTEGTSENEKSMTLMEAIAENRLAKIEGRELSFDLSEALAYKMDEYIVSLSDLEYMEEQ